MLIPVRVGTGNSNLIDNSGKTIYTSRGWGNHQGGAGAESGGAVTREACRAKERGKLLEPCRANLKGPAAFSGASSHTSILVSPLSGGSQGRNSLSSPPPSTLL